YNKRDLSNILTVEELSETLNPQGLYENYEACAVVGQGVFETLKAVSKLTLRSLKKRMLGDDRTSRPSVAPRPSAPPAPAPAPLAPPPVAAAAPRPAPPEPERISYSPEPARAAEPSQEGAAKPLDLADFARAAAPPEAELPDSISLDESFSQTAPPPPPEVLSTGQLDAADVETVNEFEEALNSLDAPLPETEDSGEPLEIGDVSFAEAPREAAEVVPEVKHVRVRSNIDILAELEKLRKNATSTPAVEKSTRRANTGISIDDLLANSLNHRKEVNRIFELQMPQRELARGHQVTVDFRLENKDRELIGEQKTFSIELHARPDIEKLLLSLKFHIQGK
ncbi:MAG: hypothetical protein ABJC61_11900, partial [Acidobacteriota bacterium]